MLNELRSSATALTVASWPAQPEPFVATTRTRESALPTFVGGDTSAGAPASGGPVRTTGREPPPPGVMLTDAEPPPLVVITELASSGSDTLITELESPSVRVAPSSADGASTALEPDSTLRVT